MLLVFSEKQNVRDERILNFIEGGAEMRIRVSDWAIDGAKRW